MSNLLATGTFNLESAAKSKGADKYKGEGELPLDVYIPQSLTRKDGKPPAEKMSLSFYDNSDSDGQSIVLKLGKAAAKSGGDKYEGDCDGTKLTLYIPQAISRVNSVPRPSFTVTISIADDTGAGKSEHAPSSIAVSKTSEPERPDMTHNTTALHSSVSSSVDGSLASGNFTLQAAAKSAGGDRYKGVSEDFAQDIYVPQSFTRKDGPSREPAKMVSLSFYDSPQGGPGQIVLKLAKAAAKSGGDKYEGEYDGSKMTLYIPQAIGRVASIPRPALYVVITQLLSGSKIESKVDDQVDKVDSKKRETSDYTNERKTKAKRTIVDDDSDDDAVFDDLRYIPEAVARTQKMNDDEEEEFE